MKKIISLILCLAMLLSFASCSMICQHRDEDDDDYCDKCMEHYSDGVDGTVYLCQHRDADDNQRCDRCGEYYNDGKDVKDDTDYLCQHRDVDDNALCDRCGEYYTDGKDVTDDTDYLCQHRDADDDQLCDRCGEYYTDGKDIPDAPVCQHRDADDNGYCDNTSCGVAYTDGKDLLDAPVCQHRDSDDNNLCDKCGEYYTDGKDILDAPVCQHRDADDNGFCDNTTCGVAYTDGQDVYPPEHVHTYGAWTQYGYDTTIPCNEQLFSRICSGCNSIEWKYGGYKNHSLTTVTVEPTCAAQGYDENTCSVCGFTEKVNYTAIAGHKYETTYSHNASFHWLDCKYCDEITSYAEHTVDDSGYCTVCNQPLAPTEGIVYDVSADGTYAEVIAYSGTATKIVIASEYQGLTVKSIYNKAFYDSNITAVTIPDSVTTIGDYAFYSCDSLTSVVIPDSVEYIENWAFIYCRNLTSVVIGDSVTTIGDRVFGGCDALNSITADTNNANYQSIDGNLYTKDGKKLIQYAIGKTENTFVIPDSVTTIGDYAFYNCYSLTSVVIPDSVTTIGDDAFENCTSLTSVVIPDSVTTIGGSAFNNCSRLTSVVIGDSVEYIGSSAFFGCSGLYTEYEYGRYVGDENNPYAVLIGVTNKNRSTYTIHENTQVIAYGVFKDCARLTSITIPDSVKGIGSHAFDDCSSLTSVVIPDSVTTIGEWAFWVCSNLKTVYYKGTAEDWAKISIGSVNDDLTSATRYYYSETAPTASGNWWHWVDGVPTIWEEILNPTEGVVYNVSADGTYAEVIGYEGTATEVVIASEYQGLPVKSIYNEAFENSNITAVTIPDSVTTIGSHAFAYCDSLTSVVIGDSVTTIGGFTFWDCDMLTSVVIPDSVTTIGGYAFAYCDSLTSVVIGDSVTTIGGYAFENCFSLTSVVIGDSVEYIGYHAFYNCNSALYTEYEYGRYVGDANNPYAFLIELTNKNQSTYTINENTQVIAYGVFSSCARLTSITIPDSVTTIGEWAFYDCSSLTSVVISDSVANIGDYAFYNCSNLKTVYYKGTAEDWAKIIIRYSNSNLTSATRYYYSETSPTASGNWWHYDAEGNVVIW